MNREIGYLASSQGKSKAEITRRILTEGLKIIQPKKSSSAGALLQLAKAASKFKGSAPKDLAFNHDYYTWGGKKKPIEKNE